MSTTDRQLAPVDPRQQIRAYLDYLEDADYVRSIFATAGLPTVMATLVQMARSDDRGEVSKALLFVRDVVNYHMLPAFRRYLSLSGLYAALRDNLYTPDYFIRKVSIHTLGKIGPRKNARLLADALPRYQERDPLLLPDLVFELAWLSSVRRWRHVEAAAASSLYLTRWSTLDMVPSSADAAHPEAAGARRLEQFYERLAADEHPNVRAEAAYLLAELRLRWEGYNLPKGERRRRFADLRRTMPSPTFLTIVIGISNYLTSEGIADYDVPMVDAFLSHRAAHPVIQPFDLSADSQAFSEHLRRIGHERLAQRPVPAPASHDGPTAY